MLSIKNKIVLSHWFKDQDLQNWVEQIISCFWNWHAWFVFSSGTYLAGKAQTAIALSHVEAPSLGGRLSTKSRNQKLIKRSVFSHCVTICMTRPQSGFFFLPCKKIQKKTLLLIPKSVIEIIPLGPPESAVLVTYVDRNHLHLEIGSLITLLQVRAIIMLGWVSKMRLLFCLIRMLHYIHNSSHWS